VTLQREAKAIADEVRPQLERPQRGLPELKRRKRSYQTAASNFLENRRRTQSGREDLLPLYFIWTTLRACNFRCTYCDDHQGHKYPNLSNAGMLDTEGGKRLLDVMRTRTPSVYFAGGEPMIRKDLPELTRHARDTGYFPVVINTNGSLLERRLRDASWRTWLADTDVIVVSSTPSTSNGSPACGSASSPATCCATSSSCVSWPKRCASSSWSTR